MSTDDRAPGLAVPNFCPDASLNCSDSLNGIRSYFTIARVSRDIFKQSSVGAVYSDWECPTTGEYNRVGGLDSRLKFKSNWTVEAQAVVSSSNLLGLNTKNLEKYLRIQFISLQFGQCGQGKLLRWSGRQSRGAAQWAAFQLHRHVSGREPGVRHGAGIRKPG